MNFYLFSQKRKCATARLKLESWNSWAPDSRLRQTAIERKEGMTRTLIWTRRQWPTVSSSRDWAAMTPTRRHWSTKHGVWVLWGRGAHSFDLVLLRSCTVPEDQVQPRNERANQPTKFFSSKLCLPPASTRRAGGRRRPLETRACLRRRWLVAT